MTVELTTRNADLADLAKLLQQQDAAKVDVVTSPANMRSVRASWLVEGADAQPVDGPEGPEIRPADGLYVPTRLADRQMGERLGIPGAYLGELRTQRPDLYDANVNGMLHGGIDEGGNTYAGYGKHILVRTFRGTDGQPGIARSALSQHFRFIDNSDVLLAVMEGVRTAAPGAVVDRADLSETRMYVRIVHPAITALAPNLTAGYRSPLDESDPRRQARRDRFGRRVGDVVGAGLVVSNSEVGGGQFYIAGQVVVLSCLNGNTTSKLVAKTHVGGKLDEGIVQWSDETQLRELALITSQATDAVRVILSEQWLRDTVSYFEEKAGRPVGDAVKTIEVVTKRLKIGKAHAASILDHFIKGGQVTAGGVMNAVTSVAQTFDDADLQAEFEAMALPALDLAASL